MWSSRMVEVCGEREVSDGTMHHKCMIEDIDSWLIVSNYTKGVKLGCRFKTRISYTGPMPQPTNLFYLTRIEIQDESQNNDQLSRPWSP